MGMAGFNGKVYYVDESCPTVTCETPFSAPAADGDCWVDEVTKFTIVDSVLSKKYGHDKSEGWQDVVAGIRSAEITLDANISRVNVDAGTQAYINAGRVLYLKLYPHGDNCGPGPLAGYAMVERVTYTYDQESGLPTSYTATLASKGPWYGFVDENGWGGFECVCT